MMKVSEFVPGMDHMDVWEIIDRVNLSQMTGKPLADNEKEQMADFLLQQAAFGKTENRAVSAGKKNMYPVYFVPDDTQKRRLFPGILPKTKLLYRNFYELEAFRVLIKLSPSVRGTEPVTKTLERLRSTCFGNFCPVGECAAASVCTLRFLLAACPEDTEWIDRLLQPLVQRFRHFHGKAAIQQGVPVTYLIITLLEADIEKANGLFFEKREWLTQYVSGIPSDFARFRMQINERVIERGE